MSTIDQAFVQAFARRNRNAQPTTEQTPVADEGIQVDPSVSESTQMWIDPTQNTVLRADPPVPISPPQLETMHGAAGFGHKGLGDTGFGDAGLADTRPATSAPAERATPDIPPHVNQHGHTAYAYAPANPVVPNPVEPHRPVNNPTAHITTPSIPDATAPIVVSAAAPISTAPIPTAPIPRTDNQVVNDAPIQIPSVPAPTPVAPEVETIVQHRFDQPTNQPPSAHWAPAATPVVEEAKDVQQPAVATEPLQPIWEVDAFDIPSSVADLFFEEQLFQLVAKRIHDAVNDGLESLVVTSTKAGEGRSTIAIGMAMAAAASGLTVALVDGDVEDPTLADDLRLDLEFGWVEAARGGLPLSQIAIYSIEDNVTLVPMMPRQTNVKGASITEVKQLISELDNQFDLIIIDGPAGDMPLIDQYAALVDSGIIAWDKSRTDADTINELSNRLQQAGMSGVGIVENFS